MNCTKTATHKFRTTLGFKQYHVILAEVQSLVAKIMTHLKEKTCKQYSILGCRIDLYFRGYKLAIETDENKHDDRNLDSKLKE